MRTGALGRVQTQVTSSWAAYVTPAGSGSLLLGWTVVYCAPSPVKGWFLLSGSDLRTKRSPHHGWLARYGLLRNRGGGGAGRRGWGWWRMIRFLWREEGIDKMNDFFVRMRHNTRPVYKAGCRSVMLSLSLHSKDLMVDKIIREKPKKSNKWQMNETQDSHRELALLLSGGAFISPHVHPLKYQC